jgi:hypothetical protein
MSIVEDALHQDSPALGLIRQDTSLSVLGVKGNFPLDVAVLNGM